MEFTLKAFNLERLKVKKDNPDEKKIYEMYYDYTESIKEIKPHRILAINRAENEKVITVNINIDDTKVLSFLEEKVIKNDKSFVCDLVKDAIKDSYKRLIFPSVEREVRSDLTEKAEEVAIDNFGKNLESLLLTPPMKDQTVLAFDPGYVNGCKLAVIDKTGKYLTSTVIKPFMNNISDSMLSTIKAQVVLLIKKYNVDIISIGNGTASRESEKFCADLIKENNLSCKYVIVSEAGASIYSTEKRFLSKILAETPIFILKRWPEVGPSFYYTRLYTYKYVLRIRALGHKIIHAWLYAQ